MKNPNLFRLLFIAMVLIFSSCEEKEETDPICPELFFETVQENPYTYIFRADFEGIEELAYTWYIDDEAVANPAPLSDTLPLPHQLYWQFEKGTYTVCIKAETPDCPNGTAFCKDIVVEDEKECPELSLARDNDHLYADYRGADDDTFYTWFVDDRKTDFSTRAFPLEQLDPGSYTICVTTRIEGCDALSKTCIAVKIEDIVCPELEINRDGDYLYADYRGADDDTFYTWFVNETKTNFTTRKFPIEELDPGSYAICVTTRHEACGEILEACIKVQIDPIPCPELLMDRDGDYLYADYRGAAADAFYTWFVDDRKTDFTTEKFPLAQLDPGSYTICVTTRHERCGEILETCKEIKIDPIPCPELMVDKDGDYLYAYYRGADDDTFYTWSVDDRKTEVTTEEFPLAQLNPGSYTICVTTRHEACGEILETCKEVTIPKKSDCPELFFEVFVENPNYYIFKADFEGRDSLTYEWYINGTYIEAERANDTAGTDHQLPYQFAAGTYEICILVETPDCPLGISFCKTIVVK